MKKQSARRKLASNLLSRGLSSLGKTLKTPVSQLTGKQKLLGALGAGAGVAAAKFGLGDLIEHLQHSNLLEEANSLRKTLKPGLGQGTQDFIRDISNSSGFLHSQAGERSNALLNEIMDLKSKGANLPTPTFNPSEFIDTHITPSANRYGVALESLNRAKDLNARSIKSMLMTKYFLTPPSLSEAVGSAVPGLGLYQDFNAALGNAAFQETINHSPDLVSRINELAAKPFASSGGQVAELGTALEEAKAYASRYKDPLGSYTKLKELAAPSISPQIYRELNPSDSNLFVTHNKQLKALRDSVSNAEGALTRTRDRARALLGAIPEREFDTNRLESARTALDRMESSGAFSDAVNEAKKRTQAYTNYANLVLPDEAALLPSNSLTTGAIDTAARQTTTDAAKDALMESMAKRLIAKTVGKSAAGLAAPMLAVGSGIGNTYNYLANGGPELEALLTAARQNLGAGEFDKLYSDLLGRSSVRATQLQTQYGKELLEAIKQQTDRMEEIARSNRIRGSKL